MGTWLQIEVTATSRAEALGASEAALRAVEAVEARLSTWSDDSELSRLNQAPAGQAVELGPELREDLERTRLAFEATSGAFDPGIGALIAAWDLRGAGRVPEAAELARAHPGGPGYHQVHEGKRAPPPHPGQGLEVGGVGKGGGRGCPPEGVREGGG
jgi:thiamine biosynthesis lipoprotein